MAASSSSSSSSSSDSSRSYPYTGKWEYDVFLCFRGEDTRLGFTSHLMGALSGKQIRTFIDDMLEKTESIDELISILERSALSVVVFSEKFADSVWCLEEVVTIARRMKEFGHRVLPIFYKVDPSDVIDDLPDVTYDPSNVTNNPPNVTDDDPFDLTDDSKSYAVTIDREYKGRSTYSEDKKRWMDALKAVANCVGHTSQVIKIESELVKAIVEDVHNQLIDMSPSIKSANLVGMGSRILEVERLLAMDTLDDSRIIGLWGMGGVGKTTLAKACYGRITSSNKGIKHCFIGSISEKCGKWHDVEGIANELYSRLLSEDSIDRQDLDISYRRGRLSRLRVFIVLDDVETPSQLEQILLGDVVMNPVELFARGSRIIVTTRNKRVLDYVKAMIYNVAGLDYIESIELFSLRAFRHLPPHNWKNLIRLAASYCAGNPLALTILGNTLFDQDQHYWRSFLSELKLIPNPNVHDILKRSYDKLGVEEKKIFLDVACLLHGISRSRLIAYMTTMYPSTYAKVKDLIDSSLLTCVSHENEEKIEVHDLLKEMAWNIVNEEPNLDKRSRLVDPDDVLNLLSASKVKKYWSSPFSNLFKVIARKKRKVNNPLVEHITTEGIHLYFPPTKEIGNIIIHFPYGALNSLPEGLRWLEWDGYPAKSLPSKFRPQHLVQLIIRESPIQRCWKGYDQPQLVNLMVLDLSYCRNLIAIPNISLSSKLEELLLCTCETLVEVPSHVQYLTKLITLDLTYCKNLKHLPPILDSKLLKHVRMSYCLKVTHCPEMNSRVLEELDFKGTSLVELPNAIYNVKQDGVLRLYGENITKFPAITTNLKMYELSHTSIREIDLHDYHHHPASASSELVLPRFYELHLYGNSQLKSLPKSIWNMVSDALRIYGSPLIESLPQISEPLNALTLLYIYNCEGLRSLPSNLGNIKSLTCLVLSKTGFTSLPSSIQEWKQLTTIDLSCCKSLVSIPSSIHRLSKLLNLCLKACKSIRSLPELPPNLMNLDVSCCKSLQALPSNTGKLLHLESLKFDDCPQFDQTSLSGIVANFLPRASLVSDHKFILVCSRSDLPEWFTYKSINSKEDVFCCVKVELPLLHIDSGQSIIKAIAFGIVVYPQPYNYPRSLTCECKVGNTTVVASWNPQIQNQDIRESCSEKLWMVFSKNLLGDNHRAMEGEEEDEAWYVKYAGLVVSFEFYISGCSCWSRNRSPSFDIHKIAKIKTCGVSLVY
ncbi:Disease resistance protein RUN1 [Linum perenne]